MLNPQEMARPCKEPLNIAFRKAESRILPLKLGKVYPTHVWHKLSGLPTNTTGMNYYSEISNGQLDTLNKSSKTTLEMSFGEPSSIMSKYPGKFDLENAYYSTIIKY